MSEPNDGGDPLASLGVAATLPSAPSGRSAASGARQEAPAPAGDVAAEVGRRIGRFAVVDRLGQGAMGLVLAAYDAALDRKVAIKVLKPRVAGQSSAPEGAERLLREARAMAKLSHPNVLTYNV